MDSNFYTTQKKVLKNSSDFFNIEYISKFKPLQKL